MGKTISEKILSHKIGQDVKAGDIVNANIDYAMTTDILGPKIISEHLERFNNKIKYPEKTVIVSDHYTPAGTIDQANIVAFTRKWAKERGIANYYEGQGPCHQILAEEGYSLPNTIVVGTDSHTCSAGAFACFGTGIGSTELVAALVTGEMWFRVPETIKIQWDGHLQNGVMAKDIILKTIKDIGHAGATYKSLEFLGSTIRAIPMDERICISNMAVEAGAKVGLIPSDEITRKYLEGIGKASAFVEIMPDKDAVYERELFYDSSILQPQVSFPHEVDNVKDIEESVGVKMDKGYIGSCTGGRLYDLQAAAEILKGRRISSGFQLLVSPASQKIWVQANKLGLLEILADAGATILAPTCGACLGLHSGLLGEGESCISTTNRNFKGRMGSPDSYAYLASPATVAATAINGEISDPRNYLNEVKK
ncbi:3-isopropylmalate dehydratase large subunit [Bacillota bacterium]